MAITKLLKIKTAKQGHPSSGLKQCLKYIANPDKTDDMLLIGGTVGGDPELTYEEILANKRLWAKELGTQGYHYILSLPNDEHPDIETMRALTEDFCKELLKDRYIHAYAIHTDKGHIHSHIVFDSVAFDDGQMFHSGKYDWMGRIQPIADKICRKYGLRSLDFKPEVEKERTNLSHKEWENTANPLKMHKDVSMTDVIRADIDSVIARSRTWSDFVIGMMDLHYDVKDGKHFSLKPEGREKYIRTGRLGEEYTKESIVKRFGETYNERPFGEAEPMLKALREFMESTGKSGMEGIKNAYFQRWYAFSYVNKSKTPWRYREELIELGKYTDRCAYLFKHDITDSESLTDHLVGLEDRLKTLKQEVTRVNNQIYNTPLSSWKKLEKLRGEYEHASEVERPEVKKQIDIIMENLRDNDIIGAANKYRSLKERKENLLDKKRKIAAELKMSKDLLKDFENARMPNDILNDSERFVPEPFLDKSYSRITVNKVLIKESKEDADFIKIKIPGLDEFLLLYKDDTKVVGNGSYASSYIYDHLDYSIIDKNNNYIRAVDSKEVMKYFNDRTINRRENHVGRI